MPRRREGRLVDLEVDILGAGIELQAQDDDFYGFALAKRIADRSGATALTAHGTLYKALSRLAEARPRRIRMGGPEHRRGRGPPSTAALPGDRRGRGRPSSGDPGAHRARTEPEIGVRLSAVTLEPGEGVELEASARIRHRAAGRRGRSGTRLVPLVHRRPARRCARPNAGPSSPPTSSRSASTPAPVRRRRSSAGRSAASPPTSPGAGRGCAAPQSARRGARSRSPCRRSRTSPRSRSSPGAGSSSGASRAVCSSATGTAQPTSPSSRVAGLLLALVGSWLLIGGAPTRVRRARARGRGVPAHPLRHVRAHGDERRASPSSSRPRTAQMVLLNRLASGAAVLFFLSMAAWWAPRKTAESDEASR